jgi:hypothetical protein
VSCLPKETPLEDRNVRLPQNCNFGNLVSSSGVSHYVIQSTAWLTTSHSFLRLQPSLQVKGKERMRRRVSQCSSVLSHLGLWVLITDFILINLD